MNILLEFTTINYKMWHSLAKSLNELFPDSKFAGIVGYPPGRDNVLDYLKSQKSINYQFLYLNSDIYKNAYNEEIRYLELKEFEEGLPHKILWRLIPADRGLGSAFMHGAVWQQNFINQNNNHENILRVFSGLLIQLRAIFVDFKPDLFLPAIAMGNIQVFIYEQLCKEFKIPYIVPSNVRIKNYFAFSADSQLRFPQIDMTYRSIYEGRHSTDMSSAQKIYEVLIGELKNPRYFDRINSRFNVAKYNSLLRKGKLAVRAAKAVINEIIYWGKNRKLRRSNDVRRQPDKLNVLLDNIANVAQFYYQKYWMTSPRFCSKLTSGEKYIYYPLHINPEYSTQIQGTMWLDQVTLIELLAKSIPFDWKVYVKEHPGTLVARTRPLSFYKRLKKIPNVAIVPIDADMHTLIINAQMVAVITGTSGWEAILRGKPLITFADNMWDVLRLSRKCCNVETLSKDIYDELRRIKDIHTNERKKRIVSFLAAMLEHSFEVSYPNQFVYTEPGTEGEYEILGQETVEALKKHLDY